MNNSSAEYLTLHGPGDGLPIIIKPYLFEVLV